MLRRTLRRGKRCLAVLLLLLLLGSGVGRRQGSRVGGRSTTRSSHRRGLRMQSATRSVRMDGGLMRMLLTQSGMLLRVGVRRSRSAVVGGVRVLHVERDRGHSVRRLGIH